jgi:two-component system OmpR family sensor kinase
VRARRSLRSRLIVSSSILLAVVCVVIAVISTLAMRSYLMTGLDDRLDALVSNATTVKGYAGPGSPGGGLEAAGLPYLRTFGVPEGAMGVAEYGGRVRTAAVVGESGTMLEPTAGQQSALSSVAADGHHHTLILPGLGAYRVKAVHADSREGEVTITTGLPYDSVDSAVGRLVAVEAVAATGGLLLAALAAAVIIGYHLRPLQRVSATATRVSRQPLDHGEVTALERVPATDAGPGTEVGRVATALNRLLGHVEGALAARYATETRMRRFLADASHELRTPLASIAGHVQLVMRGPEDIGPQTARALGRVESGIVRMSALVEDLLLLARLDAGRPLECDEVGLGPLVADAVHDAHAAGPDHRWRIELPDEPVLIAGDQDRLHQVVANLLANARTHTPPGTTVTATVETDGTHALLRVTDDGPGIPPGLLPAVFERFARGDASRSRAAGSSGLGLAIVAAVVAAHHGRTEVGSEPGRTVFTVALPLAQEAQEAQEAQAPDTSPST